VLCIQGVFIVNRIVFLCTQRSPLKSSCKVVLWHVDVGTFTILQCLFTLLVAMQLLRWEVGVVQLNSIKLVMVCFGKILNSWISFGWNQIIMNCSILSEILNIHPALVLCLDFDCWTHNSRRHDSFRCCSHLHLSSGFLLSALITAFWHVVGDWYSSLGT